MLWFSFKKDVSRRFKLILCLKKNKSSDLWIKTLYLDFITKVDNRHEHKRYVSNGNEIFELLIKKSAERIFTNPHDMQIYRSPYLEEQQFKSRYSAKEDKDCWYWRSSWHPRMLGSDLFWRGNTHLLYFVWFIWIGAGNAENQPLTFARADPQPWPTNGKFH